jgi:hypothetical protein
VRKQRIDDGNMPPLRGRIGGLIFQKRNFLGVLEADFCGIADLLGGIVKKNSGASVAPESSFSG